MRAEPKPRRPKSTEELQRIVERRPLREREREASRPFHQFIYQVSRESEWIQDEINPLKIPPYSHPDLRWFPQRLEEYRKAQVEYIHQSIIPAPADINTMA